MVLVSLVLVVLAAVTLVIGLLQSGVTIIYISIGCSLVAGIVLFVAVRRGRPEGMPAGAGAPAGSGWSPPPQQAAPAPAPASPPSAQPVGAAVGGAATAPPRAETAAAWAPDSTQQYERVEVDEQEEEPVEAGDLPVADYDRLRATDIMPLLVDLDAAELEELRAYEEAHKHRFTVLRRIDDELAARETAEEPAGWEVSEEEWEGDTAEEAAEAPDRIDVDEIEVMDVEGEPVGAYGDEEVEEVEPEPEPEPVVAAAAPRRRGRGGFPIANYDQLMMLEVLPQLQRLEQDDLLMVRQHEEAGLSRSTILNRIDRLLQQKAPAADRYAEAEAPLTRAGRAAAKRTPAPKSAAKRAPAKRTGIKQAAAKAPAAAKTPPAKRSAGVKRAAKKAVATKAPAKKVAVKKGAVKKGAVKKAGAVKRAGARKIR